jgi:glutathione synthase/RimK-type ligase-like ATP-grasp enzyme
MKIFGNPNATNHFCRMHIVFVTYKDEPLLFEDDQLIADYLESKNIRVSPIPWDDETIDWTLFDAVVIRSAWDYIHRATEFNLWLERLKTLGVKLFNPISVIQWNQHKSYFVDFSERGILVPSFQYCPAKSKFELSTIIKENGWDKAVVKPAVSAGSFNTWVVEKENLANSQKRFAELLQTNDMIVQEFMKEVLTEGEWSLLFFNKKFSHAIIKKPKSGDFRVQAKFGGSAEPIIADEKIIEQAAKILNSIDEPLLYARVDGLVLNGDFYLMELELIEPVLFVEQGEHACENFYQALLNLV